MPPVIAPNPTDRPKFATDPKPERGLAEGWRHGHARRQ